MIFFRSDTLKAISKPAFRVAGISAGQMRLVIYSCRVVRLFLRLFKHYIVCEKPAPEEGRCCGRPSNLHIWLTRDKPRLRASPLEGTLCCWLPFHCRIATSMRAAIAQRAGGAVCRSLNLALFEQPERRGTFSPALFCVQELSGTLQKHRRKRRISDLKERPHYGPYMI
jgi:hypothetical protein